MGPGMTGKLPGAGLPVIPAFLPHALRLTDTWASRAIPEEALGHSQWELVPASQPGLSLKAQVTGMLVAVISGLGHKYLPGPLWSHTHGRESSLVHPQLELGGSAAGPGSGGTS